MVGMSKYFPWKRVGGVILTISASTAAWVPAINQWIIDLLTRISFLKDTNPPDWLMPVICMWVAAGFAIWAIVDLCKKLESKPNLFVRKMIIGELSDTRERRFPADMGYLLEVTISNGLPDKPLGITDIRLQLPFKSDPKHLTPFIGKLETFNGKVHGVGTISTPINLGPNEAIDGTLVFKKTLTKPDTRVGHPSILGKVLMRDTQKRWHIFPVSFLQIIEDNEPDGKTITKKFKHAIA